MQRKKLGYLLIFLAGMATGYGLYYLDKQSDIPRLESTEIFEVVMPDDTVQLESYPEIERERQELKQLRQRLARREKAIASSIKKPAPKITASTGKDAAQTASSVPPKKPSPGEETTRPSASQKNLGSLFAKIFSQPVMEDLVISQVNREAGEMSAVLALSDEQRKSLETVLKRRKKAQFDRRRAPDSTRETEEQDVSGKSLEETYRSILTPEQYQQYQEYTEKKKALLGASPTDRDLFELTWRLKLSEEQEAQAHKLIQDQWEKMQQLSPLNGVEEGEDAYTKGFETYIRERKAINQATAEQMKSILDEDQFKGFLEYQREKDVETHLLQKLIQSDHAEETAGP